MKRFPRMWFVVGGLAVVAGAQSSISTSDSAQAKSDSIATTAAIAVPVLDTMDSARVSATPAPAAAPTHSNASTSRKRSSTAAVLAFTGNLSPSDLAAITSRFEGEMIARDSFWVLERRRMDKILQEQGFHTSGSCTTSDCQVEVGQLLGVEHLFLGDVSKVGGILTLNLRRVEVGSGRSEFSHSLDIKGKVEDVLRHGCHEMALIASGTKKPESDRSVLVPEKASLWPWVAGGAVLVGGGVAAVVLLSQDEQAAPDRQQTEGTETQVWVGW